MERISLNERYWADFQGCYGCGSENHIGLQLVVYEDGEDGVTAQWEPRQEYQNYGHTVHGGALTAALDEVAGSAAWLAFFRRDGGWPFVVTAEYTVRFRAPASLGRTFEVKAQTTEVAARHALVEAMILDGETTIASMLARFVKLDKPPS